MTAPSPPPVPSPSPDRLVVRTDRRVVGRLVRGGTWMLVVVLLVCVAWGIGAGAVIASLSPEAGATVLLGALVGMLGATLACLAGLTTYFYAVGLPQVHREVDVMAVVEPAGLHVAVPGTDAGSAYLPWDAVASVTPRRGGPRAVVVVRAVPGLRADHPGVRGLDDALVRRQLVHRGLTVRTGFALVPHEQVLAAVHHYRTLAARHPGGARPVR